MRKLSLFGFSAALLLGAGNLALANDTFNVMLSNTVHVLGQDGTVNDWIFNEDGTVANLTGVSGTWEMDGDSVCSITSEETDSTCVTIPSGKVVGDTWNQDDGTGQTITVTIVEGR